MDPHADTRAPLWQMRMEHVLGGHEPFKSFVVAAWYRKLAEEAKAQKLALDSSSMQPWRILDLQTERTLAYGYGEKNKAAALASRDRSAVRIADGEQARKPTDADLAAEPRTSA